MVDPVDAEATPGEPVEDPEVKDEEDVVEEVLMTGKKELKYCEDDEEPLSASSKFRIALMVAATFVVTVGIIFISWWMFAKVIERNAGSEANPPEPGAPTAAPTSACSSTVAEILNQLGLRDC